MCVFLVFLICWIFWCQNLFYFTYSKQSFHINTIAPIPDKEEKTNKQCTQTKVNVHILMNPMLYIYIYICCGREVFLFSPHRRNCQWQPSKDKVFSSGASALRPTDWMLAVSGFKCIISEPFHNSWRSSSGVVFMDYFVKWTLCTTSELWITIVTTSNECTIIATENRTELNLCIYICGFLN